MVIFDEFTVQVFSLQDSFSQHLTSPVFVFATLFLSCLLLTVAFLPVVWFPWLMHLSRNDLKIGNHRLMSSLIGTHVIILANLYTNLYNISAVLSLIIAPVCGFTIDYQVHRGMRDDLVYSKEKETILSVVQVTRKSSSIFPFCKHSHGSSRSFSV